jgi:hypothetical protein
MSFKILKFSNRPSVFFPSILLYYYYYYYYYYACTWGQNWSSRKIPLQPKLSRVLMTFRFPSSKYTLGDVQINIFMATIIWGIDDAWHWNVAHLAGRPSSVKCQSLGFLACLTVIYNLLCQTRQLFASCVRFQLRQSWVCTFLSLAAAGDIHKKDMYNETHGSFLDGYKPDSPDLTHVC